MIERKSLISKKNKKGSVEVLLLFFVLLFLVMFFGFFMAFGSVIFNWVYDITMPDLLNLGVIEDAGNFTDYTSYTLQPLNTIIQQMTWLTGVAYVMMLLASFGFVMLVRHNPSKWLIALYFGFALLLILGSIFMSNIYEDFLDDDGDIGERLREHVLLSWLLLHSPMVFTFITFVTGILLFSGINREEII